MNRMGTATALTTEALRHRACDFKFVLCGNFFFLRFGSLFPGNGLVYKELLTDAQQVAH